MTLATSDLTINHRGAATLLRHPLPRPSAFVRFMCASILLVAVITPQSLADAGKQAALRGNSLFEQRLYQEAALAYTLAKEKGYRSPRLTYNLARANAEIGELDAASAGFRSVIADPASRELASDARFNLGAVEYRRAKSLKEKTPAAALDALRLAESIYRDCRALDPADQTVAANIERIQREIHELESKQKASQQPQQQSDGSNPGGQPSGDKKPEQSNQSDPKNPSPSQDPSTQPQPTNEPSNKDDQSAKDPSQPDSASDSAQKSLADLADRQRELARESQRLADDQARASRNPSTTAQKQDLDRRAANLQDRQQSLAEQTKDLLDELAKNQNDPANPKPSESQDSTQPDESSPKPPAIDDAAAQKIAAAQEQAQQSLAQQRPDAAAPAQHAAADQLAALAGLSPPSAQSPPQPQSAAQMAPVDLDAAKILDKEKGEARQRLLRQLRMRTGRPPAAGKDW